VECSREPAFAVWITGLPASGKSVLTAALVRQLRGMNVDPVVLESDALREKFSMRGTYDERDREYFYGAIAVIGQVLTGQGIPVVFDATANLRAYRERARQVIPHFLEVYVDSPLEVCIQRDPKGIYRKAQEGKAEHVPGLGAVYEPPENPEVVVHGDREDADEAAQRIIQVLLKQGFVGKLGASIL
jgi:adenylylsulfate kinase